MRRPSNQGLKKTCRFQANRAFSRAVTSTEVARSGHAPQQASDARSGQAWRVNPRAETRSCSPDQATARGEKTECLATVEQITEEISHTRLRQPTAARWRLVASMIEVAGVDLPSNRRKTSAARTRRATDFVNCQGLVVWSVTGLYSRSEPRTGDKGPRRVWGLVVLRPLRVLVSDDKLGVLVVDVR
jgi:hypothetical protein